jgi:hypothetical protein
MGIRADTREEIRKESITKIFGQPTEQDITKMEKELTAIAATTPSDLGGGNYGHAGIIVEDAKYTAMTGGTAFNNPVNPGLYPAIAATVSAGTRAREEALHKGLVREYEIFCGVEAGLKDVILEAVDNDYVLEIEDEILGFLNQTPKQIIAHLRNRGGQLDFADTKKLIEERDSEWDGNEVPQVYFNRVTKAMEQLQRAGIASDLNERRDMALFYLKATGEYDPAVREWENKATADKTWANIKVFISKEFAKENKQTKVTAKQFKANLIEEQAEITEEMINNLTQAHTKQIEILMKSNMEAIKEMMTLVKENSNKQNQDTGNKFNKGNKTDEEKKKTRTEKQQKYKDTPVCKHCGKKHPSKKEEECWELEANAASRPSNWKPNK